MKLTKRQAIVMQDFGRYPFYHASDWDTPERRRQIATGTAPATPWRYSPLDIAYVALCENSMEPVLREDHAERAWLPPGDPCPVCGQLHPRDEMAV
jgi:hypothetical protein